MNTDYNIYTVEGLRNIARERGLRGYSRLRRADLIQFLNNWGRPILDTRVENINVPVLQPTIAQPSTSRQRPITPPTTSVNDLLRSLENVRALPPSISPEVKALKDKIKKIYRKVNQIAVEKSQSALKKWTEEHKIKGIPVETPDEFFALAQPSIINVLSKKRGTKVKMNLQCYMKKGEGDNEEIVIANFSSDKNEINLDGTNVTDLYFTMVDRILENFVNFLKLGSGWVFESIIHFKIHTVVYEPLRASGYIPLPKWIANKKACINMKNEDEECFPTSILRHLNPTNSHPERIDKDLKSKKNS